MLKLEHDTILSDEHLRISKAVLLHQIHYYKLNSNKKRVCEDNFIEARDCRFTKSSYETELRKMASHFELLTRKFL